MPPDASNEQKPRLQRSIVVVGIARFTENDVRACLRRVAAREHALAVVEDEGRSTAPYPEQASPALLAVVHVPSMQAVPVRHSGLPIAAALAYASGIGASLASLASHASEASYVAHASMASAFVRAPRAVMAGGFSFAADLAEKEDGGALQRAA